VTSLDRVYAYKKGTGRECLDSVPLAMRDNLRATIHEKGERRRSEYREQRGSAAAKKNGRVGSCVRTQSEVFLKKVINFAHTEETEGGWHGLRSAPKEQGGEGQKS